MTGTDERATVFRFADLRVDVEQARVTRDGTEVPLPRLSFDLLVALAEAAPAVVTIEQLLERVWPDLVVNAETVSQRVKLLRAALGDQPQSPRYLQVVRGRGYRLIPEVLRGDPPPAEAPVPSVPAATVVPEPVAPLSAHRYRPAAIVVLLLSLLAGIGWWVLPRRAEVEPPSVAAAERSIAVLPFENLGAMPDDRALALGIAEAVLHQLANLEGLAVIARSSSFALAGEKLDARRIGTRLGARYILEGSVQHAGAQLRITAQLIDATSGAHVWSLQFDRGTRDVFAMQDEIATKVAQALELSLDARMAAKLAGRTTTDFDAYFEFLQARALLASDRVVDLDQARAHLERAIRVDAQFADALVALAGVEMRRAEFDVSGDRNARLAAAREQAGALIERALRLDPQGGQAYLQRAYLRAFDDLEGAERDYRQGLALAPSDAAGYAGLAAVLYEDPARHEEALAALDRARRLDPLEPRYDVTRAVYLFYGRGDAAGAEALLRRVVQQYPRYAPGILRLGEVACESGEFADGVRYMELGLSLDASAEYTRRFLASCYLDLGDTRSAEATLHEEGRVPVRELLLQAQRRDWVRAGETVYAALRDNTALSIDEILISMALRQHARATGEIDDALATLEQLAGVSWNGDGDPVVLDRQSLMSALVGVGDLLLLQGQQERGRRLLRAMLKEIDREQRDLQRGERWTRYARAEGLALLGDADGAMAALRAMHAGGKLMSKDWLFLENDPAFDALRERVDFRQLLGDVRAATLQQRERLEQLRREGLVPVRK